MHFDQLGFAMVVHEFDWIICLASLYGCSNEIDMH